MPLTPTPVTHDLGGTERSAPLDSAAPRETER